MHDEFVDSVNDVELKFSREQGFFDKSRGVRILIASFFFLCLFGFLHFRDVKVPLLEPGTNAPDYVVSQVDFDFLDDEATIILKQESVRDIGKIYELSEREIRKRKADLEDHLTHDQTWREKVGSVSFDEISKGIEAFESTLTEVRFTDPRTLKKMKEAGFDISNYLIFSPTDINKNIKIPLQIWRVLASESFPLDSFHAATASLITSYFSDLDWQFEEDIPSQKLLRKKIMETVEDKYTHVSAGNRIIDQGDKVTSRHVSMLHAMKMALRDERNLWHPLTVLGSLLLTLILMLVSVAYLKTNHKEVLASNRKLFLLVTIIVLTLALSKGTEFLILNMESKWLQVIRFPVFVPFAAIMLCSLMNPGIATFASGFLVVVLTLTLAFDQQGFMIMNIVASIVAILSTRRLRQRKEIFIVCLKAWLSCVVVAFAINLYQYGLRDVVVLTDSISAAIFMLLTAVMVVGLLPLFESLFKIMTDVTLMEYFDPNNDLLRRLSIEAPGTYQHSVVVGNLAEAAALSIGANGLFCRVATMYHDIGKMITPQYFTENQLPGMNIHQLLTPLESAQVIIAHVSEGVALARKASLPEQFIDIIKQHHGTTLVYYFYKKQLEKLGGDKLQIDQSDFRYSGPKPRSKESVIIMIADSLEAASRSLDAATEKNIEELADRLIKDKADDGQFDECLLTFEELALVKETLIKTLVAYSHSRIKYPAQEVQVQKPMPDINA